MKLKVVFLFLGLALGSISHAQIKIGTNPENINAASVLELESTSRTLVLTRVNSTEMNIIRPLQGALVYNTETKCVHYYDGDQWLNICDALTNSVNISMVDNGDGSYTFTDANGIETIITTTTNSTFEVANDSLVLTDSNNNTLSVALDSLNRHTYSTDAIVNVPTSDSTIVIRRTGNNYNFEVGEITGLNIRDKSITRDDYSPSSINGLAHIQGASIVQSNLAAGSVGAIQLLANSVTLPKLAPGTTAGQLMQWNGTNWVLVDQSALTITESDGIIGNEVVNAFDGTLVRLGMGTNTDPYTLDVSPGGINTADIAPFAIGTPQLANNAITSLKILDGEVTTADILNETILSEDIANGTIANADIANDAVTSNKILDGTIVNVDISPTAAIDGTKINPNFGAQPVSTIGTLASGNATVTGTISSSGTITVGANTITNVDGTNGQVLTTDGAGSATWASLPADNDTTYTPGEAITLTGTEFSIADGDITSAKITNETILDEDVSPTAAIAGIKIDPEFGPQNITTTGTLNTGDATVGTLSAGNSTITGSLSTTGTATVGANTITDVDGTNGQVLTTDGAGSATWTSLPADNDTTYTPGEAITLTGTEFSIADGDITSAKITNETILDEDVSPTAAIAGIKIDPEFGPQNITTTGTLASGNTTITGTLSTTGTATVGANTITNIDGTNGQVLTTDGAGTATWTSLPADNDTTYTPGEAITLTGTEFSIADGDITSAKITNETILDEDVSPTAAIAGIKIDPEFGPQNITTTGTLASGNTTITGTLSTTGTATVGANTITNIDGTNGQVLTTDGAGTATWTSLPADNDTTYTPGEAITLTGTEFSIADGDITSAKITNETILDEDVSPTAAIAGIKIDPDFGPQNITTTGTLASGNTTITGTLAVSNEFLDANGDAGTVGQILSSTAAGTDWINPTTIVAMGKVDPDAISERTNSFVNSVDRNSLGNYTVTFTSTRATSDYIIQLTLLNAGPGTTIEVTDQQLGSFEVQITQLNLDTSADPNILVPTPIDADWYFTVTDF